MVDKNITSHLKQILSMDSYSDPTMLPDGVVKLIENMRPDKKGYYTREGLTQYNPTAIPTGSGVFGNAIHITKDGTEIELAMSAGKLYSGEAGVFTERYIGLSPTNLCSISQFGRTSLIVDQLNGILTYTHGKTPFFAGISSPKTYKLIESLEDVTLWNVTNGTKTLNEGQAIHGEYSIDFKANTGAVMTALHNFDSPLNLDTHSDGSSAKSTDYISLYFLRGDPNDYSTCYLDLGDHTFTNYFRIDLAALPEWIADTYLYTIFDFKIRRSAFTSVGTPAWNNIEAIRFVVTAMVGDQPFMTVDFIRMEKTGPIPTSSGVAGNPNGVYYYQLTYETTEGDESDASLISSSVTVVNNQINLTNLPLSGSSRIVRRTLYRIGGSSSLWRFVTHFEDNVQTTFTDNVADDDLGSEYLEVEGSPYIPKCLTMQNELVIIANLTSPDGLSYPNGVMVSEPNSFEVFDHLNFFEIESDGGDKIYWVCSFLNFIFVGKGRSIWKFDAYNLDNLPSLESRLYGGVGPLAVIVGENEFYFLDKTGVISYNGSFFECISDTSPERGRVGGVKNYIDAIPSDQIHKSWLLYFDKTLLIGIPQTGDTYPTTILAYYTVNRSWYVITGWEARCGYTTKNSTSGHILHLGLATLGRIHRAFYGETDDGVVIEATIQTGDSDYGMPDNRKDYNILFLYGNKLTSTDINLSVIPYIDLVEKPPINYGTVLTIDGSIVTTITGFPVITAGSVGFVSLTDERQRMTVPQLGYYGTHLGLKLVTQQRWTLRGLTQVVRILEDSFR